MKTSRYTEAQIIAILRQAEGGVPVAQLCREHGMSDASFYKWRAKYGGMDASMVSQSEHCPPLMRWMAPASGIAMCHIGCCEHRK